MQDFRIAIIGQSAFSEDFLKKLVAKGYNVCGVFTIPDKNGREDVLATAAKKLNIPTFKIARWRALVNKGPPKEFKILADVFEQYKSVNATLNVLPYCNAFIPMEVINYPPMKSINYHPSLLPRHRGAASINWTLIHGDKQAGLTIFWTDDGLDTGPILMKKSCFVQPNDTVDTLYRRFLFPAGVDALLESVELIRTKQAPKIEQPTEGATYEPILRDDEQACKVDFTKINNISELHNYVRGMDKVPGAWISIRLAGSSADFDKVKLFSSSKYFDDMPETLREVQVDGLKRNGIINEDGLLVYLDKDPVPLLVSKLQLMATGKTILASLYGSAEANQKPIELDEEEEKVIEEIRAVWTAILSTDVSKATDFFNCGAGSMDVVRLVEEVKEIVGDDVELENEDVYMATQFEEFSTLVIRRRRGEKSSSGGLDGYVPLTMTANKMELSFPNQLFINNQFVDSVKPNNTMDTINPTNEQVICKFQIASKEDVDRAVRAAKRAFRPKSEWRQMNARDRGKLLYKLADLMERHLQELATLESLDSGAVYTLALKTHIGMSIDAFRYFAGWCDKIHGKTIPINNARPNSDFCSTRREPVGVCGIITPWNYPLMMVAWKSAACLAAGNTLVLKPASACPLTALKWAELTAKAGFPPGVVNIVPGSGSECGQAILDHPDIRKVGFTGSTPTGKQVMKSCALSNIKKCSLELGGKSPLIIFADCDMNKAVKFGMSSVFFNKGENCIAAGRLFVEDSIHDEFVAQVLQKVKEMPVGDPLKRSTAHGPQNHLKHLEDLIKYCDRGVKEGATLVYGGRRCEGKGYFFMPTIFTDVTDDMFIAQEESFGPIMIISRFANEDEEGVVRRANKTIYGLASGVITNDLSKASRVADGLHAGTVFINVYNKTDVAAPFGGFKQSGFGKDLGEDALNEYLVTKTVTAEY